MPMFMVLSSWQSHYVISLGSLMNVEQRQAAADPQTKPATWAVSPPALQAARVYTHHHHLLLLLSPKADTHFTIPRQLEG